MKAVALQPDIEPILESKTLSSDDAVCPTCGRALDPPCVQGDGSVWAEPSRHTMRLTSAEVQRQLVCAEERVAFNPKDADARQALWVWQEVARHRLTAHGRTAVISLVNQSNVKE